jgi:hypothetical protein
MKRHRNRDIESEVLRELDRLVWHELQALQPGDTKKQAAGSKNGVTARKDAPQEKESVRHATTVADGESASRAVDDRTADSRELDRSVETPAVQSPVREREERCPNIEDVDSEYPSRHAGLLDREEEEFVAGAVDWLRARLNPDEIIATIWSRVTEAEPKAFYEPDRPSAQAQSDPDVPSEHLAGTAQSSTDRG